MIMYVSGQVKLFCYPFFSEQTLNQKMMTAKAKSSRVPKYSENLNFSNFWKEPPCIS